MHALCTGDNLVVLVNVAFHVSADLFILAICQAFRWLLPVFPLSYDFSVLVFISDYLPSCSGIPKVEGCEAYSVFLFRSFLFLRQGFSVQPWKS